MAIGNIFFYPSLFCKKKKTNCKHLYNTLKHKPNTTASHELIHSET